MNSSNIVFSYGETKSCVFRKIFFDNFYNKSSCFPFSNMQVREKNSTIFFFSKLIVPILYLAMETPKIVFLEKLFSTTFITKVRVFLVQICKFVKKKAQFCFLSKRITPIISLSLETPKVVVLKKIYLPNSVSKVHFFLF
jgi:hypothetical protein